MQEVAVLIACVAELHGKVAVSRAGSVLLLAKPRPLSRTIAANHQVRVAVAIGKGYNRTK